MDSLKKDGLPEGALPGIHEDGRESPPGHGQGKRIILHVDMDSFYASVEVREHPDLAGKPVVVGADPLEGRGRGVVATCSYEAREFGIHSAMPISRAFSLCPHAVFLRPRFALYEAASGEIMNILRGYSGRFQQVSIDEAYLDLSHLGDFGEAEKVARRIKEEIAEKTGLTCSIGIGPGRIVAKIASDFKKPDGLTVVRPEDVQEFLAPLPVGKIPGIGRKTGVELQKIGVMTIGNLGSADIQALMGIVGRWAVPLRQLAGGVDESWLDEHGGSRSVSRENTFDQDTSDPAIVMELLDGMAEELCRELADVGALSRTVTVKVRFGDFRTVTRARSLLHPTRDPRVIMATAHELAEPLLSREKIRLAGLRLSSLVNLPAGQRTLREF